MILPVLALLAGSAAILVAAILVAAHLSPRGSVAFVVATLLLAHAMVVTTVGVAGLLLRSLAPGVLLVLAFAWPIGAALAARRYRRTPIRWRERWWGAAGALRTATRWTPAALATLLVAVTLAWRAFLALRVPVVDYDGWSYHLVFTDVWLQHNALTLVQQRPWTAGYPADTELLTTWLVAFTRSDAFAGFTSLLPIPLAIAAITGLARAFGAGTRIALLAGMLFGMTPAIVALAGTSYVDAASIATVASTWWLGLRVVRGERDRSATLLLGIAGGLALGTKGSNAILVAPILAVAGLIFARDLLVRRPGSPAPWAAFARVALFAVPILVLGLSWYLKNTLVFGNPVYPFAVGPLHGPTTLSDFALAPPAQLKGRSLIAQVAYAWTADWRVYRYAYNVSFGGFGRAWPLILLLAAPGLAVLIRRRQVAPLLLVIIPAVVTFLWMPMPWYARLTLFVPGVGVALAAVALHLLRPRLATAGGLLLVGCATISLLFANALPNVGIQQAFAKIPKSGPAWVIGYVEYLLDPSDARRSDVSLRAECAGFDVIPAGSRVAPGGFNLLHAVVGPERDRILADLLGSVSGPEALASAVRSDGATWLVTSKGAKLDRIAASAPGLFVSHGEVCRNARLWELRPGA